MFDLTWGAVKNGGPWVASAYMRAAPTVAALLLLAGCPDEQLSRVFPVIAVEPEALDFGTGIVGADNPGLLTVLDRGAAPLELAGYTIEPETTIFRVVGGPSVLPPSGQEPLLLAFRPERAHERTEATLVIRSNDPERPVVRVPLVGVGGVREIEVSPLSIDFGVVDEGTAPSRAIEIANVGGDPLDVRSVAWSGTSTSIDLALAPGGFTGGVLAPGTSTVVRVVYSPVDLGGDHGTILIRSDDEDEPLVEVEVRGYANLAPRAIAWGCEIGPMQIGCDGAVKRRVWSVGLRQRLALDGRETLDPEGAPIATYRWALEVRPADSAATVFHSTDDRMLRKRATGDLEVDKVGRYELRLIATDDRGLQSLDRPESRVTIRPKDLEILLRWDVPTDVDLHVVRPGGRVGDYGTGRVGTSTGSDVTSFNRAPNWGDLATEEDDPRLDIDDVSGRGPEIVSLDSPEDGAPYAVFAHYCDSRGVGVPVNVTAEVYVRGVKVAEIPEGGLGYPLVSGEAWEAAAVVWRRAALTADVMPGLGNRPVARPDLCRR